MTNFKLYDFTNQPTDIEISSLLDIKYIDVEVIRGNESITIVYKKENEETFSANIDETYKLNPDGNDLVRYRLLDLNSWEHFFNFEFDPSSKIKFSYQRALYFLNSVSRFY